MTENLKDQTVKGVWWSVLEKYSTQGVSFIITLVMANILSPDEYGLIGMLAIFMSLSQVFIDGGFANALIQKKTRTDTDFSTVFWINISIGVLCYILLFIFAPAISSYFKQDILVSITRIYSINLILNSLCAVNKVKLVIDINFKTQLKISLAAAVTSGIAGIICAVRGCGVWAIVVQLNVQSFMTALLSFIFVRWRPAFVFSRDSFRSLFGFGSKLLIAQTISTVYVNLYNIAIGRRYTAAQLGLYTRARQFGEIVSTNLTSVMTRVLFPVLSRVQDDDAQMMAAYRKFIAMVAFIVFPCSLGLCGIARPLVVSLIGEKWSGCVPLLQILTFAYLCDGITIINLNLLYVKGKSDIVLKLEIIKKSIAVAFLLIAIRYGVSAICISLVIYSFIALIINTRNTKRLLDYGFLNQLADLFPYLLCSLTIMALAFLSDYVFDNNWLSLSVSLILCPLTYIFLCRIFRLNAQKEMASIIASNKYCPKWFDRLIKKMYPVLP